MQTSLLHWLPPPGLWISLLLLKKTPGPCFLFCFFFFQPFLFSRVAFSWAAVPVSHVCLITSCTLVLLPISDFHNRGWILTYGLLVLLHPSRGTPDTNDKKGKGFDLVLAPRSRSCSQLSASLITMILPWGRPVWQLEYGIDEATWLWGLETGTRRKISKACSRWLFSSVRLQLPELTQPQEALLNPDSDNALMHLSNAVCFDIIIFPESHLSILSVKASAHQPLEDTFNQYNTPDGLS